MHSRYSGVVIFNTHSMRTGLTMVSALCITYLLASTCKEYIFLNMILEALSCGCMSFLKELVSYVDVYVISVH